MYIYTEFTFSQKETKQTAQLEAFAEVHVPEAFAEVHFPQVLACRLPEVLLRYTQTEKENTYLKGDWKILFLKAHKGTYLFLKGRSLDQRGHHHIEASVLVRCTAIEEPFLPITDF